MGKHTSEDDLRKKKSQSSIRIVVKFPEKRLTQYVTTVHGQLKNLFLDDCIKRGMCRAQMMSEIMAVYYGVVELAPHLREKEMKEVKSFIIGRIKF